MLALTSLLFLALATDGYQGDNHRSITHMNEVPNALGSPGAILAGFMYMLVGHAAHVLYFLTGVWGMMLLRHRPIDRFASRVVGFLMLIGFVAGLLHLNFGIEEDSFPGGAIGAFVAHAIEPLFGFAGANVLSVTLAIVGILLATEFLFIRMLHGTGIAFVLMIRALNELKNATQNALHAHRMQQKEREAQLNERALQARLSEEITRDVEPHFNVSEETTDASDLSRMKIRPVEQDLPFDDVPEVVLDTDDLFDFEVDDAESEDGTTVEVVQAEDEKGEIVATPVVNARTEGATTARDPLTKLRRKSSTQLHELPHDYEYPKRYRKPSLTMLDEAPPIIHEDLTDTLRQTGLLLEETLLTFGIEAQVTDVTRGPTITRYEIEPAPGIKVSRFMALADDLALALKAHRVRVEAPIPGKGRVGIEVPNDVREPVVIRELLESHAFRTSDAILPLALGKDISGDPLVTDLTTMPHLLVAGATGAGKTVCVKTFLANLLFMKTPDELQLMLIDPKMVELSIFNDIPHLITPVVIDPKKAATALNWLISEMEERYRLFAHLRVRNIEVYNESVDNGEIEMDDTDTGEAQSVSIIRKLPYIVCIIDELADLMMLARAEVEDAIARLAQLARAVGIHLVIATQRPSVDVLTGVIKANFPARVSFQVSSRVDSRCILDEIGAERLVGRGDMLYLPAGQSKPTRIQGAFVSDAEMNDLIAYLKTQAPPQYRDEIANFGKPQGGVPDIEDDSDELLDDAVRVVVETGQASISMIQRRLRVGYTRAARLIDMMEVKGIVGPHVGSKARTILIPLQHKNDEVA